jgi:hypothetical protein
MTNMAPNETVPTTTGDELFRAQAAKSSSQFSQLVLARQQYFRVDLLIGGGVIAIGALVAACSLISLPKHHFIHGVVRSNAKPFLLSLAGARGANSSVELHVEEGQRVEKDALIASITTYDAATASPGRAIPVRSPVSGLVNRIDTPGTDTGMAGARIAIEPVTQDYSAYFEVPSSLERLVFSHQMLPLSVMTATGRVALTGEVTREWVSLRDGQGHGAQRDPVTVAVRVLPSSNSTDISSTFLQPGMEVDAVIDEPPTPLIALLLPGGSK